MKLILILEDVRSAHNVGAILRTAEAAGVAEVIFTGLTPHPPYPGDPRPPYIADRAAASIAKTALGAEQVVAWRYEPSIAAVLEHARHNHYQIAALELADTAVNLFTYTPPDRLALVVGHETVGVTPKTLEGVDVTLQIPMAGRKESLNVSVAAGIALYQLMLARTSH